MPAVQVWIKMLWKYEGVTDDLDCNLLTELQDLTKAGKSEKSIHYVKRELEQLLDGPQKRFTTAEEVCSFLTSCTLQEIIRSHA